MKRLISGIALAALISSPAAAACKTTNIAGTWRLLAFGMQQEDPVAEIEPVSLDCRLVVLPSGQVKSFQCFPRLSHSWRAHPEEENWRGSFRVDRNCGVAGRLDNDFDEAVVIYGQMTRNKQIIAGIGFVYDHPGDVSFQIVKQ